MVETQYLDKESNPRKGVAPVVVTVMGHVSITSV